MQTLREIRTKQNLAVAGYLITVGFVFTIGFMLLRFPENAGRGVSKGVELSLGTLIPSMFPFMLLSTFTVNSGILERLSFLSDKLTQKLFRLPGVCAAVILFSMTGGLPIGPKMTADLYARGYITLSQGQRMLFFCMNPGPAFVITAVGYYMLGSERSGLILYVSVLLSSVIIGILSSFVWGDGTEFIKALSDKREKYSLQSALQDALVQSGRNMLTVCGWVIIFSCLTELVSVLPLGQGGKDFVCAVLEMTNGCDVLSGSYPVPLIAGVIGFGGICAHMQVMSSVMKLKLKLKYFICARILNGGLAVLIAMLLLELFPVSAQTFAMGTLPERRENIFSVPLGTGILVMCFLLMLGENFSFKRMQKKR